MPRKVAGIGLVFSKYFFFLHNESMVEERKERREDGREGGKEGEGRGRRKENKEWEGGRLEGM